MNLVKVTGEIDATNIDHVYEYTSQLLGEAPGLILDLSEVDFLCARGISVLFTLDSACRDTGTHWAIVAGPFVRRLLHIVDPTDALPVATAEGRARKTLAQRHPATPNSGPSRSLSS